MYLNLYTLDVSRSLEIVAVVETLRTKANNWIGIKILIKYTLVDVDNLKLLRTGQQG